MKGMKKHGMMYGGKVKKMAGGGKMKMVKNNKGEMVPDFAADGIGRMMGGGKTVLAQRLCKRQEGYALP